MADFVTTAVGNAWSNPLHWLPTGVPGDGDFASIGHNTTIDQNIGTSGNGIKRITVTAGLLSFDAAASRTIYFGSTGTNPIGSGTASAPAADATMFGFFNNFGGQINLQGTSSNILTITSGNGTSPWYLFSRHGGSDFRLQYVDAYHVGTASANFEGIGVSTGYQLFTVLIDHCRFTDLYGIRLYGSDPATGMITYNSFTGSRASGANGVIAGAGFTSSSFLTISDNTESAPVNDAYFIILNTYPVGTVISRNAVLGTSSAARSLVLIAAASGHSIINNVVINTKSSSGLRGISAEASGTTVRGNYISGSFLAAVGVSNTTGNVIDYNFLSQENYSWTGQGNIFGQTVASLNANHNVMVNETVDLVQASESMLLADPGTSSNLFNFNTVLGPPSVNGGARSATSLAISFGEPGASGTGNIFRNNLICGWYSGYYDNASVAYAADFASVGVHHNAFFDNTTNFLTPNGNGEANFGTGHPNATYGEFTLASTPGFIDPLRRATTWDVTLGGPGTNANVFTELAKRSGFGGTYNSAYNIPALMTYVLAGFSPTNSQLRGVASDGTDIGAVVVTVLPSTGLSRIFGMYNLDSLN